MSRPVRKIFLLVLLIQLAFILFLHITRISTTNHLGLRSSFNIGPHYSTQSLSTEGAHLSFHTGNISKGEAVFSDMQLAERAVRKHIKKQATIYIPALRSSAGEMARRSNEDGETMRKRTEGLDATIKTANLDDTKTRHMFQQIDDKQAWIYSAFFDHVTAQQGRASVRIFGIIKKDFLHTVYCNFTTSDGHVMVVGSGAELKANRFIKCPTSYIECDLSANTRPTHVSISFQKNKTATNRLQIIYPGTLIRNFTVCYSILHSNYNSASQLIQSIEMNRILGAEHFVLYNYSVSPAVDHILQHYEQDGLLTVLPWSVPIKKSCYFGQMTALNDCFYRNRNTSRFIVVVDTDEFLIPKKHSNWMELIAAVSPEEYDVSKFVYSPNPPKKALSKTGCFIVRSSYFTTRSITHWTSLPSQFSFSAKEKKDIFKYKILPLSQFYRSQRIFPHDSRPKYIARPDLTFTSGVHFVNDFVNVSSSIVNDFVNVSSSIVIPTNLSLVFHYRQPTIPGAVHDTSVLRFKSQLYTRVIEKLKQFPGIFIPEVK